MSLKIIEYFMKNFINTITNNDKLYKNIMIKMIGKNG